MFGRGPLVLPISGIDPTGAAIDFLLSSLRDDSAAKRLFRRALGDSFQPQTLVTKADQPSLYGSPNDPTMLAGAHRLEAIGN